jgi:hypothetical protein
VVAFNCETQKWVAWPSMCVPRAKFTTSPPLGRQGTRANSSGGGGGGGFWSGAVSFDDSGGEGRDRGFALREVMSRLFAIGGDFDPLGGPSLNTTIELFDQQQQDNSSSSRGSGSGLGRWTRIATFPLEQRLGFETCVFERKVFIFGGQMYSAVSAVISGDLLDIPDSDDECSDNASGAGAGAGAAIPRGSHATTFEVFDTSSRRFASELPGTGTGTGTGTGQGRLVMPHHLAAGLSPVAFTQWSFN